MNEDKKRVISEYSKIFSARLKYAMEQRNLKQVDLVNMTNIDKSKISSYLSGRYMPKQDGIYLLAKALDVDEAWLMGLDVPMDRDDKSSIPLISNYQKNLEYSIQCFFVKNIEATINNISKKYFGLLINEDSEFYPLLSSGDIAIIEENNEIENGKIIPVSLLSAGTIDQMYLCLRLNVLSDVVAEKIPFILDEPFAFYDDKRIENTLNYLNNHYSDRQIIIFSCSNREHEIFNKIGLKYNLIEI